MKSADREMLHNYVNRPLFLRKPTLVTLIRKQWKAIGVSVGLMFVWWWGDKQ